MECKHCGSKNLQIISEYLEISKKKPSAILSTLKVISIVLISISFFVAFLGVVACNVNETGFLLTTSMLITALALLGVSLIILSLVSLIKLLQPYEHKTQIRIICMDCGKSWIVSTGPSMSIEELRKRSK